MHRLYGSHQQKIDDKARLSIPAKLVPIFREIQGVSKEEPLKVVVTVSRNNRLGIYPEKSFLKIIQDLEAAYATNIDAESLRETMLNYMDEQTVDGQNRVRIPSMTGDEFDLNGEVVVMGSGDYLEVVSRNAWKEQFPKRIGEMNEQLRKFRMAAIKPQ